MVAEVHQTLGYVVLVDTAFFDLATFEDQLMTYATRGSRIDDTESIFQTVSHVVGVQDGDFRSSAQTFVSHQTNVCIGDSRYPCTSVWSSGYFQAVVVLTQRVRWQEWSQVLGHTDRTYTRTSTSVGDGKGLVQIQMAHVCSDEARTGQSYLSIHVGTVHIHLTSTLVDAMAKIDNVRLEDTVRTRVGNHHGSDFVLVLFGLSHEVLHIYVASLVASYRHRIVSALDGTGRIGTVGRSRQDNQMAVSLSDAVQIAANSEQSGVFACCTGVRLERSGIETGDNGQVTFEAFEHLVVAFRLVFRSIRVNGIELRHREVEQLGCGIQLHRTRTQRNHGVCQ